MITLAEQIAEAQRELALRRTCYPAWVTSGKLDAGEATYQIRVQEAIVRTLLRVDAEQRQLSLFARREYAGVLCIRPQCRPPVATALFATTDPAPAPRGGMLLIQDNVDVRRLDASAAQVFHRGAVSGSVTSSAASARVLAL